MSRRHEYPSGQVRPEAVEALGETARAGYRELIFRHKFRPARALIRVLEHQRASEAVALRARRRKAARKAARASRKANR
jgi:hypothetical protein